jgi:GT2 family glycosyltransferase
MSAQSQSAPDVTVAVVSICSARHLERCLQALADQELGSPFEIIVAFDPALDGIESLQRRYPNVRMVSAPGQRSPLELAGRALSEARGAKVLLTEDHCIPDRDWVATLSAELDRNCGAAGGVVDVADGASPTDWAFFYVDFFRYAGPLESGESPTLSVCNVGYRRRDLEALDIPWRDFFHETTVNNRLRAQAGPLWLSSKPRVCMKRHVRLRDALYERYAFGRLFACTRTAHRTLPSKLVYRLGSPLLPWVLGGRMVSRAVETASLRRPLLKSAVATWLMVLSWSYGEWLGYWTERRPRRLTVAQEID